MFTQNVVSATSTVTLHSLDLNIHSAKVKVGDVALDGTTSLDAQAQTATFSFPSYVF